LTDAEQDCDDGDDCEDGCHGNFSFWLLVMSII
jgi:hypothetical protein